MLPKEGRQWPCCLAGTCLGNAYFLSYRSFAHSCSHSLPSGSKPTQGHCNPASGPLLWENGCLNTKCTDQSGFATALRVAGTADAVVVMLALDQDLESEVSVNRHPPDSHSLACLLTLVISLA